MKYINLFKLNKHYKIYVYVLYMTSFIQGFIDQLLGINNSLDNIHDKIKQLKSKREDLLNKLKGLEDELAKHKLVSNELTKKLDEALKQTSPQNALIIAQNELNKLKQDYAKDMEEKKNVIEQMTKQTKVMQDEIADLNNQLGKLENEKKKMSPSDEIEKTKSMMQEEINKLKDENVSLKKKELELVQKNIGNQQLSQELNKLKTAQEKNIQQINQLSRDLETRMTEYNKLLSQLKDTENKLEQANKSRDIKSKNLTEQTERHHEANRKLKQLDEDLKQLREGKLDACASLEKYKGDADVKIQKLEVEKQQIRDELSKCQQELSKCQADNKDLTQSVSDKSNTIIEKDKTIAELQNKITELENKMKSNNDSINQLQEQINKAKSVIDAINKELGIGDLGDFSDVIKIQGEIQQKNQEIEKLKQENETLNKQKEENTKILNSLNQKIGEQQTIISEHENKNTDLQKQIIELNKQYTDCQQQIGELQNKMKEFGMTKEALESLQKEKIQKESELNNILELLKSKQEEIQLLSVAAGIYKFAKKSTDDRKFDENFTILTNKYDTEVGILVFDELTTFNPSVKEVYIRLENGKYRKITENKGQFKIEDSQIEKQQIEKNKKVVRVYIKKNQQGGSSDPFYQKYLKYKNKYVSLKKSMK